MKSNSEGKNDEHPESSVAEIEAIAAKRGLLPRSPYGKKGGTSVNASRKAVRYKATLPNGKTTTKTSFQIDQPEAVLGCFQDQTGKWIATGITDSPKDWGDQIFVKAIRVTSK